MQEVSTPQKRSLFGPKRRPNEVHSIKDITRIKERIPHRRELPDDLLKEFVKAINDACESGELPYVNYRLEEKGSPHRVMAHYWCHTLDPVYRDTAKKLSLRDKITFDEAWHELEVKLLKKKLAGLAFILTTDTKSFWYRPADEANGIDAMLYHNWERTRYTPEEKALLNRLKNMLRPEQHDRLINELRK
jgi:hypothetical protein